MASSDSIELTSLWDRLMSLELRVTSPGLAYPAICLFVRNAPALHQSSCLQAAKA